MKNEDVAAAAPTNVTGPQVAGTGSDPVHWKDKKRKLREIVPMVKRKPVLLGQVK